MLLKEHVFLDQITNAELQKFIFPNHKAEVISSAGALQKKHTSVHTLSCIPLK